jgi:hypothetical protein
MNSQNLRETDRTESLGSEDSSSSTREELANFHQPARHAPSSMVVIALLIIVVALFLAVVAYAFNLGS